MSNSDDSNDAINRVLADHQSNLADWDFGDVTSDLHVWAGRMISEFKFEIGVPALSIEYLSRAYGHYRNGRNGFGLIDEIAIDEQHVRNSPYWRVLGTLLHELTHSWQFHNGRPGKRNYHNKAFRAKALELGLLIDESGYTEYAPPPSPFLSLIEKYDVDVPDIPEPDMTVKMRGNSKLKLYECPCGVKARIGRKEFRAMCLNCEGEFELKERIEK